MRTLLYLCLAFVCCASCMNTEHRRLSNLMREWTGKTVYLPADSVFESFEGDSVRTYSIKRTDYTVVTYLDSLCCSTNDLPLQSWKAFIDELRSFSNGRVTCLFFFHPERRETLVEQLRVHQFNFPVCIDEDDLLNKLNHFPDESPFRTFLLDRDRKIVALGNPIDDPSVQKHYLQIIAGEKSAL